MDIAQFNCQHIVRALRVGHVPVHGLHHMVVGRAAELQLIQADLERSQRGGAWLTYVIGHYSAGKTFFCSLVREEAWRRGFIVAAVDLGRDPRLHRFDVIYHRIMDAMRTELFPEVPAFEFVLQEWLSRMEHEVQRATGLNPMHPAQRGEISRVIGQRIGEYLAKLRIYDRSFANAVHGYYDGSRQGHETTASTAVGWLKGEANLPDEVCKALHLYGRVDHLNAVNFLQAVAALIVHIGYSGLVVILDEVEAIRSLSRPESRDAAYENIRLLMAKAMEGGFAHCGFMLAGTEDPALDPLRDMAFDEGQAHRLTPEPVGGRMANFRHLCMVLSGFDRAKLLEVARKVREVHSIAYAWEASTYLPDDLLKGLVEKAAATFGERVATLPRGFLKGLVDLLDKVHREAPTVAADIITTGIDAQCIEAVEQEGAHLLENI